MYDLVYELKRLVERNRDGSLATLHDRKRLLMMCGKQLVALGYRQLHVTEVSGRHIHKLVTHWQAEGISTGTLANRLAALRYWCEHVGRASVMAKTNAAYGIVARVRVSKESKAKVLPGEALAQVTDAHIQMSLRLVQAFGLRRKESLLVRPHACDQGAYLALVGSMTKNGKPREIPILTLGQREVLDAAKHLIQDKHGSMIPPRRTFIQQRRTFDYWVQRIGLGGAHGLRHAWAQDRYEALSGMACPHRGGPTWDGMTAAQREADTAAREMVSQEMGHERVSITAVYLGAYQEETCPVRTGD